MSHAHKLTDVATLRRQARQHVELGAVTAGYSADRGQVLKLLNEALATEIVCVLRYRRHHFMARGIHGQSVGAEFLVHSNEEQGHADLLAARIVQLGGEPDFAPDS
jgi:bacterioferritin